MKDIKKQEYTTKVYNCARCGEDHKVTFKKFKSQVDCPCGQASTHWGMCPVTREPILMYFVTEFGDA